MIELPSLDSLTITNHSRIKQNAMNTNFTNGYVHLTKSEKETIFLLMEKLKFHFHPDSDSAEPSAFVITDPVAIKADRESFFNINSISLKLLNQKNESHG